jgi:hypothetical protein
MLAVCRVQESEQIVCDLHGGGPDGVYTAYVQLRASIPLWWMQEGSAIIAKPDILIPKVEPMCTATRAHFEDLFKRYG